MKKFNLLFMMILICASLHAQEASIASRLRQFSPLADIHIRNLGMEDKNTNGTIDKDAGEGYEAFIEKYGNADVGFHANGVIIGANNGRLEENEIINHYYINIRFKDAFAEETITIDEAVKSYVYANSIPLVWLDDAQGTVMNAVTRILGENWNKQEVSEDEAVRMFNRAMRGMNIRGRTGDPGRTGYYTLPEMVNRKSGYCFEVAQFGFWFFSELKIKSITVGSKLTESFSHAILQVHNSETPSNPINFDYFGSSLKYSNIIWEKSNPMQEIGELYATSAAKNKNTNTDYTVLAENAVKYNKYYLQNLTLLILAYNKSGQYQEISDIGYFIFEQINIDEIMTSNNLNAGVLKDKLRDTMLIVAKGYSLTGNREGFNKTAEFLNKHSGTNRYVVQYLEYYQL